MASRPQESSWIDAASAVESPLKNSASIPAARGDRLLLTATFLLLALSMLMIYSTTAIMSDETFGQSMHYLTRHAAHITVGLICLFICARIPHRILNAVAPSLLLLSIFLLVLVLFPSIGQASGGARRWLPLGIAQIQPGELVKLCLVVYFSSYVGRHHKKLTKLFPGVVIPMLITGTAVFLLLLEPDFGSSVVVLFVVVSMLFVAGVRSRHLIVLGSLSIATGILLVLQSPYRLKRLESFLDPFADPAHSGYQLIQSLIAVGSGGIAGVGLGSGQQKLFYLPAAHTDFIYAVVAEELGMLGASGVLLLFGIIGYCGLRLAMRFRESPYLASLAIGCTLLIILPALLNVCVVLGLLPTKGLVLPLLGYGGSSMMVSLSAIGLLYGISRLESVQ